VENTVTSNLTRFTVRKAINVCLYGFNSAFVTSLNTGFVSVFVSDGCGLMRAFCYGFKVFELLYCFFMFRLKGMIGLYTFRNRLKNLLCSDGTSRGRL
jgi:hypothetical protein